MAIAYRLVFSDSRCSSLKGCIESLYSNLELEPVDDLGSHIDDSQRRTNLVVLNITNGQKRRMTALPTCHVPCGDPRLQGSAVTFSGAVVKGKVFPYSLPSVGPGADPGVQAVSPQVA